MKDILLNPQLLANITSPWPNGCLQLLETSWAVC